MAEHEAVQVVREFVNEYFIALDLDAAMCCLREPFLWVATGRDEVYRSSDEARGIRLLHNANYGNAFQLLQQHYEYSIPAPGVASVFASLLLEVSLPEQPLHQTHAHLTALVREGPDGWKIQTLHGSVQKGPEASGAAQEQTRLEKARLHDALTGIYNMEGFVSRAGAIIRANPGRRFILLKFGINNFRYVNQSCGFDMGDRVLRNIAKNLTVNCRDNEACARVEKDIFAVMMVYEGPEQTAQRMEQLRVRLVDQALVDLIGINLTFRGGLYLPHDIAHEEIKDMLDKALIAMQSIPGRITASRYVCFEPSMAARQFEESQIMDRAQEALAREEIKLYIQPLVAMKTGQVCGGEALARWVTGGGEVRMPDSFIPLFEQSKFILVFDFYMLRLICRQLRAWLDAGLTPCPIFINQSRYHLEAPDYIQRFTQVVDEYRIPHRLIIFELTENVFIEDTRRMMALARNLHREGFLLAIDDFGTGFASLNLLSVLSADILKIDRSLVADANTQRGLVVLRKVVEMAKETRMRVVCEGVETEFQAEQMGKLGCDIGQGFYYHRPRPAAELEQYIKP